MLINPDNSKKLNHWKEGKGVSWFSDNYRNCFFFLQSFPCQIFIVSSGQHTQAPYLHTHLHTKGSKLKK